MVVLGISGRRQDAAAALAVDGELVAAATEETLSRIPHVGYAQTGGIPRAAVAACLERASLTIEEVGEIAVADEDCRPEQPLQHGSPTSSEAAASSAPDGLVRLARGERTISRVDPLHAHAVHAAAAIEADPALVLVVDFEPARGGVFLKQDGALSEIRPVAGLGRLLCTAHRVARTLGHEGEDPWEFLELLGSLGEPEFAEGFGRALTLTAPPATFATDDEQLSNLLEEVRAGTPGSLADTRSANVRVQQRRRALAASFNARLLQLASRLAADLCEAAGIQTLGVSGSLFARRPLNTRLRRAIGHGFSVAPVPEAAGCAVGAALAGFSRTTRPLGVRVGPEFSDTAVKQALENCRLDYIYEPDWQRLLGRVSKLLARGKLVAWFQGAMEFGPRSLGSRSILCDPSNRYARDNITRFLKQWPEEEPLPVSLSEPAAAECLVDGGRSPFMLFEGTIHERWRHHFRGALDHCHSLPVHTVSREQAPELWDLLELHRQTHGVPGLINTTLSGPEEPTACSPRDAIRTTFSSAVDALVMSRFLVMKDYWLLRSDTE